MKVVYKYNIVYMSGNNIIDLPEGAEIISVKEQRGMLVLWALVDPACKLFEERNIVCVLTGQHTNMENPLFLDTVLLDNGNYVVHVFEELGL